MRYAPEIIGDVPVICLATRNSRAALNILAVPTGAASARVGTDRRARDGAAGGGDISAASASDLVTQHAANDCTDHGTWNIRTTPVGDPLALNPAPLLGRTDDCMDRSDGR